MAQEHQEENSVDPANHNIRRKRGRPRKDEIPGSEPYNRIRRRKINVEAQENDPFIGQVVSGVLDGKFDAGYMLTVRVGERGSVLRGVVFEPGLSVPISAANDVAPNVKMFKRTEVSLPSARQLPCFAPIRRQKDGALRCWQRNDSAMSSKGICMDPISQDPNANIRMHSSVDIQRLSENDSNPASGNLKQDLHSTVGVQFSKDGIQNEQFTNASAECSKDIHVPEGGNITVTVHLQEVVNEDKPMPQLSQTISESNQAAISDGRPGFTTDNKTTNLQEIVGDVKLNTQNTQSASEAKHNPTAHLQEVISDSKPVNEVSRFNTSESKHSAVMSDTGPVFATGALDDYGKALLPVSAQTSELTTGSVAGAKSVTEVSQTKTSESEKSAETSDAVFKNEASDDHGKASTPFTVQSSGQLTEGVGDAEQVSEVSQAETYVRKQATETSASDSGAVFKHTSDSGAVFKHGQSDDYCKVLPPVTVETPEQRTEGEADAKPITEVSQSKTSESKQSASSSGSGPVSTNGASDNYVKASPPVTVQTSEHIADGAEDLCEALQTTELSGSGSGVEHSVKLASEDGTIKVAETMNSCVWQESLVHLERLGLESNKPAELPSELLMDNALTRKVIPEQLQNDQGSPCGASNEVQCTATNETTNSGFQGADVNRGS